MLKLYKWIFQRNYLGKWLDIWSYTELSLNHARFLEPGVKKFYGFIEPKKRLKKVMQSYQKYDVDFLLDVRQTRFFAKFSSAFFRFGHF